MTTTKITAPAAVPGKVVGVGGLVFVDGVAETDNPSLIAYARRHGYGVGSDKPRTAEVPEVADPREVEAEVVVGTRLRDAAVDPQPGDFLPPTNAGKANPHGPKVVAPQIHASENQVVRPGQVFVEDLAAQEKAETEQATALLVDNRQVGDAVPTFAEGDEAGPIGLSDPGSVHAVATGDSADVEDSTNPDGSTQLKGKELDAALDAAGLSKTGTVRQKQDRLAAHSS